MTPYPYTDGRTFLTYTLELLRGIACLALFLGIMAWALVVVG